MKSTTNLSAGTNLPAPKRGRGRPRIHPIAPDLGPEPAPPSPPPQGRANPSAPNHLQAVQRWSEICRTKPRPMAPSSIAANEVLWGAWCQWLAAQALHWSDATTAHVRAFLDGPAPSLRRRRRPPRNPARMSSLTRVRYFRVLKGVYENAAIQGWIEQAPTMDAPQPAYNAKEAQGAVLPPGVLARLQNTNQLRQTFAPSTDSFRQWWLLRDRAIVALVAETGITSAELINLKLADLGAGGLNILQAMDAAAQPPLHGEGSGTSTATAPTELSVNEAGVDNPCGARMPLAPVVLTIPPSLTLQGRSLTLPARVCETLLPWIKLREHLLTNIAARLGGPSERAAFLRRHSLQGPLFPSRQRRRRAEPSDPAAPARENVRMPASATFSPMESAALYLIFKRAFAGLSSTRTKRTAQRQDGQPALEHHGAQGPSVIRNTLIQQWLKTLSEEEAQWRAGFKTIESLRVIARGAGIDTRSETQASEQPTQQVLTPHAAQHPPHPEAAAGAPK